MHDVFAQYRTIFSNESNTRYFELTQLYCSNQMNYSDVVELLFDFVEPFKLGWTIRYRQTIQFMSNYSNRA